jgi:hypothetical protein
MHAPIVNPSRASRSSRAVPERGDRFGPLSLSLANAPLARSRWTRTRGARRRHQPARQVPFPRVRGEFISPLSTAKAPVALADRMTTPALGAEAALGGQDTFLSQSADDECIPGTRDDPIETGTRSPPPFDGAPRRHREVPLRRMRASPRAHRLDAGAFGPPHPEQLSPVMRRSVRGSSRPVSRIRRFAESVLPCHGRPNESELELSPEEAR